MDFHDQASGIFNGELENSMLAELLALEKALRRLEQWLGTPSNKKKVHLIVNTDSMSVINGITHKLYGKQKALFMSIHHALNDYKITMHHVKAHAREVTNYEQMANAWCDQAARQLLKDELFL